MSSLARLVAHEEVRSSQPPRTGGCESDRGGCRRGRHGAAGLGVELERVSRLVDRLSLVHLGVELDLVLADRLHVLQRLLLDLLELREIDAARAAGATGVEAGNGRTKHCSHSPQIGLPE